MSKQIDILEKRLGKLQKNYTALKEYKILIEDLCKNLDIYDLKNFESLKPEQKVCYINSLYILFPKFVRLIS